mgnify:CR=1
MFLKTITYYFKKSKKSGYDFALVLLVFDSTIAVFQIRKAVSLNF